MRSGKIITFSVWLMICFNLLLSFSAVWHFQRMNPEIQGIYERNIVSLDACEKMLVALAGGTAEDSERFYVALNIAEKNITEAGEPEVIGNIKQLYSDLQTGNEAVRPLLVDEISRLNQLNRDAVVASAQKAQRLRQAGAWGIVMMTLLFFIIAIFFEQKLRRALLDPLHEISSVLESNMQGDRYRRCQLGNASSDMKKLFQSINNLLDRKG